MKAAVRRSEIDELVRLDGQWLDGLEFCRAVYATFDSMRAMPGGVSKLRLRNGAAKKVVEELLPIAFYVQQVYRVGLYLDVCWHRTGDYDAAVRWRGPLVDVMQLEPGCFLEVTGAMHANDNLLRRRLEQDGFAHGVEGLRADGKGGVVSEAVYREGQNFIHHFADIVVQAATRKARNHYPKNTTLIIECTPTTVFTRDDWGLLRDTVVNRFPPNAFTRVFICSATGEWCDFLHVGRRGQ